MYNKVIICGRLGKDVELKDVGSNKVSNFTVATTTSWVKDGEKKEAVEWFNVSCWGKVAENCSKFLAKGSLVLVEGKLVTNKYQNKDGVDVSFTKIEAFSVKFLSTKPDASSGGSPSLQPDSTGDVPF